MKQDRGGLVSPSPRHSKLLQKLLSPGGRGQSSQRTAGWRPPFQLWMGKPKAPARTHDSPWLQEDPRMPLHKDCRSFPKHLLPPLQAHPHILRLRWPPSAVPPACASSPCVSGGTIHQSWGTSRIACRGGGRRHMGEARQQREGLHRGLWAGQELPCRVCTRGTSPHPLALHRHQPGTSGKQKQKAASTSRQTINLLSSGEHGSSVQPLQPTAVH